MVDQKYVAGVCNIGKKEIKRRYLLSVSGFVIAALLTYAIVYFNLNVLYSIFIFIPLVMGFEGFYQGYLKFCAGLAAEGVYDLIGSGGVRGKVNSKAEHKLDMKTAMKIHMYSIFSSLPVEIAIFLIVYYL